MESHSRARELSVRCRTHENNGLNGLQAEKERKRQRLSRCSPEPREGMTDSFYIPRDRPNPVPLFLYLFSTVCISSLYLSVRVCVSACADIVMCKQGGERKKNNKTRCLQRAMIYLLSSRFDSRLYYPMYGDKAKGGSYGQQCSA